MLHIEVTTPERTVFKDEVDAATIPTADGEITVLPGHIPLVSILAPGAIVLHTKNAERLLAISSGFIQVEEGNRILILADSADKAEELDLKKIEAAREQAAAIMREAAHREDASFAEAAAMLERESARLHVLRRHRSKGGPTIAVVQE